MTCQTMALINSKYQGKYGSQLQLKPNLRYVLKFMQEHYIQISLTMGHDDELN